MMMYIESTIINVVDNQFFSGWMAVFKAGCRTKCVVWQSTITALEKNDRHLFLTLSLPTPLWSLIQSQGFLFNFIKGINDFVAAENIMYLRTSAVWHIIVAVNEVFSIYMVFICSVPILIAHSHTHYNPNDHFVLFYLSCLYLQHLKFVILSKINAHESLQLLSVLYFFFSLRISAFFPGNTNLSLSPPKPWKSF